MNDEHDEDEDGEESEPRFRSGVIKAYRFWKFAGGPLVSITSGELWPPFERLEAHHNLHSPGVRDCHVEEAPCSDELHCGIYAMVSPFALVSSGNLPQTDDTTVWGQVNLWGKVIEHDYGFRAQYAYPSWIMCHEQWQADIIHEMYGVKTYIHARNLPDKSTSRNDPGTGSSVTIVNNAPSPATVNYDCSITFTNGYYSGPSFQYNGAADPASIAKWIEGVLPHYMTLDGNLWHHQMSIQLKKR